MMEKLKETVHMGSAVKAGTGLLVIKTYKPHSGKSTELENVLKTHWHSLHAAGLTTECEPVILRSSGGHVLELFEFKNKSSVDEAHSIVSLKSNWDAIKSLADIVPLASVPEARDPYATFRVVDVSGHKDIGTAASIVAKKPHPDKEKEVLSKLCDHDKALRKEGLITDRPAMWMKGETAGHVVEVHEWKDMSGAQSALKSESVSSLWSAFHEISDVTLLADLPEAQHKYATFTPLHT